KVNVRAQVALLRKNAGSFRNGAEQYSGDRCNGQVQSDEFHVWLPLSNVAGLDAVPANGVAFRRVLPPVKFRIVFEDKSLIVVDKPAGLLTMATDTEKSNTLYALLRAYLNSKNAPEKLFIVHRLDREASGLLVFAKTPESKERLQDQFKDHSAGRRYIAV